MTNPLANPDQFAVERDVAAMWKTEAVKQARATAGYLFSLFYGRDTPEEMHASFDQAIDEYVTNYLFKAAASDAAHPRFGRDFMPAYSWDGRDVPGARMGGDNPDNCYRIAGIEHGGHYRVTGRRAGPAPAQVSFTVVGNYGTSLTIQTIESVQLEYDADGGFIITIDDQPANGRSNHLTTAANAKFLFIRESFEDWETETSYHLAIERLNPVDTQPLTVADMAARAAFRLVEDVPLYCWFQRLFSGLPDNSLRFPNESGKLGGLVTQAGIQGYYKLRPDECVLVRYRIAGAAYVSTELADWWFRSIDAHQRQSSLTRAQSVEDGDGWISVVVAGRDPGIANWLDTAGADTILFFLRWQGLPAEPVDGGPAVEAKVIKMADLHADLFHLQPFDPDQREEQIARRRAAWDRRTRV